MGGSCFFTPWSSSQLVCMEVTFLISGLGMSLPVQNPSSFVIPSPWVTSMNRASLMTWVAYVKWVGNTSFVFRYWDLGVVCYHSIIYPILTDAVSLEPGNQVTETELKKPQRRRVTYCSASHWAGAWKFGSRSGTTILLWAHAYALVLFPGPEY